MRRIFKQLGVLLLLLSVVTFQGEANTTPLGKKTEYTKAIKKNYKMNSTGTVELRNKYGHINLKTWDKNEVNIEVTITVNTRSESAANDVFDRIDVDFSNSDSRVSAETTIESKQSSWWGKGDNKSDFKIDYEVSIPNAASLELANKYGDANIEAIGGRAEVSVKYGSFDLESVAKDAKIYVGYGNATIGSLAGGEADINYSKFKLKNTDELKVNSKYSKVYIDRAEEINSLSKYDNYDIGELRELSNQGKYDHFEIESVNRVNFSTKYTEIEIDELIQSGEFQLRYGGAKIESLKKGFDAVTIESSYAGFKIFMDDNVNFELDAIAENASVNYPSGMDVNYESRNKGDHEVKGKRGGSGGKIKARMRYGSLRLK